MKEEAGTGKGKAIFIIAMSTIALVLGSALMLTAIRDRRIQTQASCIEVPAQRDGGAAGNEHVREGGFIGAGSEAGCEDNAAEGSRRSMGDEAAAEWHLKTGIAVDLELPYRPEQGTAADGAELAVSYDPSVLPLALGDGEGIPQEGQDAETGVDYMGSDPSREMWEAEEEKTEQQLEAAKERLNELTEMLKDMAEIQSGVFESVFMTY